MDFGNASLAEMRQYVKENGIKGVSAMKKKELAEFLMERQKNEIAHTSTIKVETIKVENNLADESKDTMAKVELRNDAARNNSGMMPARDGNYAGVGRTEMISKYDNGIREERNSSIMPEGRTERYDRVERSYDRPERTYGRSDRAYDRSYDRQDRGYGRQDRGYDRNDRNDRSYDRNDRGYDRQDRGYDRQDRGYDRQDRNDRSYDNQSSYSNPRNYNNPRYNNQVIYENPESYAELDSGKIANGILEVMSEGYGFIRSANYLPGDQDIYVSPAQIRRFGLKTGDIVSGNIRIKTQGEKFSALLLVSTVNGESPSAIANRKNFEDLTPIFPNERIKMDGDNAPIPIRMMDLLAPIGKGQRGMIVSPPKTGKTTLLKQIAKCISTKYSDIHLLVLLIDERPEEVTDIRESIEGPNVEVIYSTFDELPEHHKRVSEMVIERAKRLVEQHQDVVILLDSITRLARAYNLTVSPSGRTLSGGLDPAALHMPKKFFGAARNMREGGSLTILATALVETGSKMDDVVFEEFKGTGNMELVLDRKLSEKRIFPAIDIAKSGTRRDDLLLDKKEQEIVNAIHKALSGNKAEDVLEDILKLFERTKDNEEFMYYVEKTLMRR